MSIFCFCRGQIVLNTASRIVPFKILETEIDHQTELSANSVVAHKIRADGILSPLMTILFSDGIKVFPMPFNAPPVMISMHMKICEILMILKNIAPAAMVSFSFTKMEKSSSPAKKKSKVEKIPAAMDSFIAILKPLAMRSGLLLPKFCPVKAQSAVQKPPTVIQERASI